MILVLYLPFAKTTITALLGPKDNNNEEEIGVFRKRDERRGEYNHMDGCRN